MVVLLYLVVVSRLCWFQVVWGCLSFCELRSKLCMLSSLHDDGKDCVVCCGLLINLGVVLLRRDCWWWWWCGDGMDVHVYLHSMGGRTYF